jgi:hypothetical protein
MHAIVLAAAAAQLFTWSPCVADAMQKKRPYAPKRTLEALDVAFTEGMRWTLTITRTHANTADGIP